jgi:GGDEF domain-containing protein
LGALNSDSRTAYHFSGDEFGLIWKGGELEDVEGTLETIFAESLNKFSYGIASMPADGADPNTVAEAAEGRMRAQKAERKRTGAAPERPA